MSASTPNPSPPESKFASLFGMNLGLLLISTSGVLGKSTIMAPEVTIFWRCLFAMIILGLFVKIKSLGLAIKSRKDFNLILLGGSLMGLHWVTYFYSLSLSSVAIAIISLHTFPAMTALLEPLILKTKFQVYHLILALLVIAGIYFIVPSFDTDNKTTKAVAFGLFSALAYALRNIFTRKVMPKYNGSSMMFFQLCVMTLMLSPFLFLKSSAELVSHDWPFILGLAVFTTCIGHTLLVVNLKRYSAVTVALLSSIIPIYGIIWPLLFLGEIPRVTTLIGGAFILASFSVEAWVARGR